MRKKSWTLQLFLSTSSLLPIILVLQSIAVSWAPVDSAGQGPASRWIMMLAPLGALVTAVVAAAFGGPLISDKIKKDAGVLDKEM